VAHASHVWEGETMHENRVDRWVGAAAWRRGMAAALCAGLVAAGAVPGAAAETRRLDLGECVRRALEKGPNRAAVAADLRLAQARLEEARAGRFGESEYTQVLGLVNQARGDAVNATGSSTAFFDGLGPFTRLGLDIRIPLYTFGKLSAALAAAEKGLESERANGAVARAETTLDTTRLYYGLLLSRQLAAVLGDMLENMDEAIEKTQKRLDEKSHSVTELDLLRLKIGRSKFAKAVSEVEASTALTRSALARAIDWEEAGDFDIADDRLRPVAFAPADLQSYLDEGPCLRPEWKQLENGIAAQSAKVDLQEANYYPSVFLATGVRYGFAGNRTDQKNPFVYDDFNFIEPVGVLGLHWDLNFFSNHARVEQERATLEKLEAQRRDAERGLRLDIERAYLDLQHAKRTIEAAREGRKAGRGLLILSVSNFDLGFGDAEDLFQAFGSYTETSTDYFRAVHDFNISVAALSRALGRDVLAAP